MYSSSLRLCLMEVQMFVNLYTILVVSSVFDNLYISTSTDILNTITTSSTVGKATSVGITNGLYYM